jgi:hypothetical protein
MTCADLPTTVPLSLDEKTPALTAGTREAFDVAIGEGADALEELA